jgi:benzil reductase ((S)-benzoin forming)
MSSPNLYIITGSSKGIGDAIVRNLLRDRSNEIIGISRTVEDRNDPYFKHIRMDLSHIENLIESTDEIFPFKKYQKIVLINNAGWIGQIDHLGELDDKNIQKIFEVNTIAPAILMNAFIKKYRTLNQSDRIVVNISSGAARKALDGWSCYSSTKAALNMMTEAAQVEAEMNKSDIRFFAVAPGVVDTEMQSDIRSAKESSFSALRKFKDLKENNELLNPVEAAEKILYLIQNADKFSGVLQDIRQF